MAGRKFTHCEWCGHPIGAERGPAAKTCSPECERDRNNAREKARYQRVKDSPAWQATRADYMQRIAERTAADPEFAARRAAARRRAVRKHYDSLTAEQIAQYRAQQRRWWHQRTPEERAARRYWYGTLTPELKRLYLLELRERRAQQRLQKTEQQMVANTKWNEENTPLLGTKPDADLARDLGVSASMVRYQRDKRGIQKNEVSYRVWTDAEVKLLGTDTDVAVGREIGRSTAAVRVQRVELGIPAYKPQMKEKRKQNYPIVKLNENMLAMLAEIEPLLLLRYQAAGLPLNSLEPWQVLEIALKELLANVRKTQAKARTPA